MADEATTNGQLGKRIDKVEDEIGEFRSDLGVVQTTIGSLNTEVATISHSQHTTENKIDQLLAQGAANKSVKGMVPATTIFAAVSILIAMMAVAVTMFTLFGKGIQEDISHSNQMSILRHGEQQIQINDSGNERTKMQDSEIDFLLNRWAPHMEVWGEIQADVAELKRRLDHREGVNIVPR